MDKGISMDEDEFETIRNWSREEKTANRRLNNLFEVQQFLGFCHYYRQFISKYSEEAEPLMRLTKKMNHLFGNPSNSLLSK